MGNRIPRRLDKYRRLALESLVDLLEQGQGLLGEEGGTGHHRLGELDSDHIADERGAGYHNGTTEVGNQRVG